MSTAQPIRSNDELNLFKEFYLNNRPNVRNYALICIGLNSALRISDVLQLRWEGGITLKDILDNFKELQEKFGDRSILRAVHFIEENERVENEVNALISGNIDEFLRLVSKSGDSSYKYLQNIYSTKDTANQGVSLGLMMSEIFLGDNGECRVHGGGFAGTILAIVKDTAIDEYRRNMDKIFGDGASMILQIRHCGGVRII